MLRKIALSFFAVCVFISTTALASDECKKGKFVGSYTRLQQSDPFHTGVHTYVQQLTLHTDGSAMLNFTGFPDYLLNLGTGAPGVGGWKCREDDKLVVNLITNAYFPDTVNGITDLVLAENYKDTYLFTITDQNTLTRNQFRRRTYAPAEDPTNPNLGMLEPLNTAQILYRRSTVSDADLLAP